MICLERAVHAYTDALVLDGGRDGGRVPDAIFAAPEGYGDRDIAADLSGEG